MATLSFEIELELDGALTPYRPAYTHGLPENCYPAEGGEVEDLAIADAGVLTREPPPAWERGSHDRVWVRKSFLKGVDTTNPEVQKLLGNLLNLVWEDAEQAIVEDGLERAA